MARYEAATLLRHWATGATILVLMLTACGESAAPGPGERARPDAGSSEGQRDNAVGFPLQGPKLQASVLKPAPGARFAHGTLIVFNRGSSRLRLDGVSPLGVGGGLRPLGVRVAGLDRKIGFDQMSDWPVTDPVFGRVVPPEGFILEPADAPDADRGYAILLGYEVLSEERSTVKGVRVDYTNLATGAADSITFQETLAVCPGAENEEECAAEEGPG